ncbi:hypothetical protein JW979_15090 [bacterium]|nr:hypothetical protein [candidate division CSSED10-310 bacterium]
MMISLMSIIFSCAVAMILTENVTQEFSTRQSVQMKWRMLQTPKKNCRRSSINSSSDLFAVVSDHSLFDQNRGELGDITSNKNDFSTVKSNTVSGNIPPLLSGLVYSNNRRLAIFKDSHNNSVLVSVGESVEDWSVLSIETDEVILNHKTGIKRNVHFDGGNTVTAAIHQNNHSLQSGYRNQPDNSRSDMSISRQSEGGVDVSI